MEGNHNNPHLHHHYQHQNNHQLPWLDGNMDPSLLSSLAANRYPQWSFQETKDFLIIRDNLDLAFLMIKRNKLLWEVISSKMREKGYHRSAEQCKCKWKNLVTRYKECETSESEEIRQQFPFFNDMQAIFRVKMKRMMWAEDEEGTSSSSRKKLTIVASLSDDEKEEEEEDSQKERGKEKKKVKNSIGSGSGGCGEVRSLLEDFMKQQYELEVQWREAFEAREWEKRAKEMEWRQTMAALKKERMVMDQRWRERQEKRIEREEARAEKRDALVAALLNELRKSERDHL